MSKGSEIFKSKILGILRREQKVVYDRQAAHRVNRRARAAAMPDMADRKYYSRKHSKEEEDEEKIINAAQEKLERTHLNLRLKELSGGYKLCCHMHETEHQY